jgi:Nuclease-related domain
MQMRAGSSAGDEAARSLRAAEELRRRAAWHEKRAASYARGRQGELAVAQALDALAGDGYRRIDDCRWPGRPHANIDHVLIGPAGLFVIDAKNWSGRVDVRDGVLRQNGHRRAREAEATVQAAHDVARLLPTGIPRVSGALCLCGDAQLPTQQLSTDVSVVNVTEVAAWLRRQPAFLSGADVTALYGELTRRLQPASRTAVAATSSPVPDFIPEQWPAGPIHREPAAVSRRRHAAPRTYPQPGPKNRFSWRQALFGRALLVLLLVDAAGSAALSRSQRVGGVISFVLCVTWLVRLERRRPVLQTLGRR